MTLFQELEAIVRRKNNSNFNFDLEWITQIWIAELCALLDNKLIGIEQRVNQHTAPTPPPKPKDTDQDESCSPDQNSPQSGGSPDAAASSPLPGFLRNRK